MVHVWDSSGFGARHTDVQGSSGLFAYLLDSICSVDTSLCFGTLNVDPFSPQKHQGSQSLPKIYLQKKAKHKNDVYE